MILPFDELNLLIEKYNLPFLGLIDEEVVEDDVYDLLIAAFIYGVNDAKEMLDADVELNALLGERIIHKKVAGKTFRDRIRRYFDEAFADGLEYYVMISGQRTRLADAIVKIAETETTRVFSETIEETGRQIAKETGRKVLKQWVTMGDERVRTTHAMLDGVRVPLGDLFHTIDGDSAKGPGGFSTAEENCGCRCWLQLAYA